MNVCYSFLTQILDKVHMQFETFMDDPVYRDQHTLYIELIQMFARVAPNAEPRFREQCKFHFPTIPSRTVLFSPAYILMTRPVYDATRLSGNTVPLGFLQPRSIPVIPSLSVFTHSFHL